MLAKRLFKWLCPLADPERETLDDAKSAEILISELYSPCPVPLQPHTQTFWRDIAVIKHLNLHLNKMTRVALISFESRVRDSTILSKK